MKHNHLIHFEVNWSLSKKKELLKLTRCADWEDSNLNISLITQQTVINSIMKSIKSDSVRSPMDSDSEENELYCETCSWQVTYIIHVMRKNCLVILDVCTWMSSISDALVIATELNRCGYISECQDNSSRDQSTVLQINKYKNPLN